MGDAIPQIASLSQAVHTGKESSKKHVETAEWSLIARDGSTEISTAAEACAICSGQAGHQVAGGQGCGAGGEARGSMRDTVQSVHPSDP